MDSILGTGIIQGKGNNLTCEAGASAVIVNTGAVVVDGRTGILRESKSIPIDAVESGYSRTDRIVARKDLTNRRVCLDAIKGTPTTGTPAAPELTRTTSIYEVSLCQALISGSGITTTDERGNALLCGFIPQHNSLMGKPAILKFSGSASALPTATALGLHHNATLINTAGVPEVWNGRDFVIPDGYNFVKWWGGFCGIGGTTAAPKNFGWVKCDPTINGAVSAAGIPNASALTFCDANYLGITHNCYTPIAEAYVTPGDKIGFSVYCTQNQFWMYSTLFHIELMNV